MSGRKKRAGVKTCDDGNAGAAQLETLCAAVGLEGRVIAADPLPPAGAILRRVDSREMGTVLGPCDGGVEVEHGWIDEPPDRWRFTLTPELWTARAWRYATPLEAETYRRMN